jgi:hypothetical protein
MLAIATLVMVLVSCSDGDEGKNPTVEIPPLKVTPAKLTLSLGEKGRVGANVAPVTYSSSATDKVPVDASTGEVEGLALGDAVITAMMSSGETASATVTVVPVRLEDFNVTPGSAVINIDSTLQIVTTPIPANTTYFNPVWTSSDESVATVTQTGLITGVGDGTAVITVAAGDTAKYVNVSVILSKADIFKLAIGYWQFEDESNLGRATRGPDLEVRGTVKQVNGPSADNKSIQGTPSDDANLVLNYPRAEDTKTYTIMWDAQFPAIRQYYAMYWLEGRGDFAWGVRWRDGTLQGGFGDYQEMVAYTETDSAPWVRIVLVMMANTNFEIDTAPFVYSAYVNGRPFRQNSYRGEPFEWLKDKPMYFLADQPGDSEDHEHPLAALAVWDRALTPEQIASLGEAQ